MTPTGLGWTGSITYRMVGDAPGRPMHTLLWCGWKHHAVEYALNLQTMTNIVWVQLHDSNGTEIEVSA